MGDRLTQQTSLTPYGDIFDQLLPSYIAMGMTYDEYWDGEVGMKTAYREGYGKRIEQEQRIADRNNWMMGQYIISVLNSVPLLVAGLNVKRGTHLPSYAEQPIYEKIDMDRKEEDKKRREEEQSKLAMAMFQAAIERFNRNIQKRQEQTGQEMPGQ